MDWGQKITYLAETAIRGNQVKFGLKDKDRLEHVSVLGRVGADRASVVAAMALQDIGRGMGSVILDASGYFTELILERIPPDAQERIIYLDPSDAEFPFSWNSLEDFRAIESDQEAFTGIVNALAALYRTPPSRVIEFVAEELLNRQDATMLLLYDLVQDQARRDQLLPKGSPEREDFEACLKDSPQTIEAVAQHGRYLAKDSLMRNVLGQSAGKFTLDALLRGGVVVVDLSRIRVFPTRITPLVRLFVHAVRARSRAAKPEMPFSLYLFDTTRYVEGVDIEQMLPERSVAFTFSDAAYYEEESDFRAKVVTRSGSVIAFAPSAADSVLASRIFFPYVGLEDLSKLEAGECAAVLSIDAVRARPFFARTFPLPARQNVSLQDIQVMGRTRYSLPRRSVDQLFARRTIPSSPQPGTPPDPGSFSNAFRSIFAKSAAGAPQPPAAPPASFPQPPVPSAVPAQKADAAQNPPGEISEEELKKMLYVKPVNP